MKHSINPVQKNLTKVNYLEDVSSIFIEISPTRSRRKKNMYDHVKCIFKLEGQFSCDFLVFNCVTEKVLKNESLSTTRDNIRGN